MLIKFLIVIIVGLLVRNASLWFEKRETEKECQRLRDDLSKTRSSLVTYKRLFSLSKEMAKTWIRRNNKIINITKK